MLKKVGLLLVLAAILLAMLFLHRGDKPTSEQQEKNNDIVQTEAGTTQAALAVKVNKNLGTVSENPDGDGIVVTLQGESAAEAFVFEDIPMDSWYIDAVNYVASTGLMRNVVTSSGRPLYCPDYGVTRAQFATILYRFCGGEEVEPKREYADVPDFEWYYNMIHWVDIQGLLDPLDSENFGPSEHLSCEEVLIALHRVAGEPESFASLEEYPYAPKVSQDGMAAVRWAWGIGLIAEDECIWYPTQAISRAQLALLLMRYDAISTQQTA